ncbi:MAG: hypothetical protein KAX40_02650 [Herpetosiphon sp.]|nr:hypothetical protein [Herpetosiphon sp.]
MKRWMFGTMIVCCLILATMPSMATATNSPNQVTSDDAFLTDAKSYVEAFGGTQEEAVRRLKLQQPIGDLGATLQEQESATFGGLWIEHTPNFKVVVQLTKGSKGDILKYIYDQQIADVVEIRHAPNTHASLRATQEKMNQFAKDINTPIESGIVVQSNQVEVYVEHKSDFENRLSKAKKQLPQNVVIVERSSVIKMTNWYAGRSLAGCTVGFSMRSQNTGQRYSSTAGHCQDWAIAPLLSTAYKYEDATHDFRLVNVPNGDLIKNWAVDADASSPTPYYREIYGTTYNPNIGDYVCKYGKTTFFTCGTIHSTTYSAWGGSTWYEIYPLPNATQKMSCGGDSGGPIYAGNIAYAFITGGWCSLSDNRLIAMPVSKTLDFGFEVLTSP